MSMDVCLILPLRWVTFILILFQAETDQGTRTYTRIYAHNFLRPGALI